MEATGGEPTQVLRTPRAAGAAGIVFALLLSAVIVLVRIAVPGHPTGSSGAAVDQAGRDALRTALALVPFAGVFFLWFMGAVRDHVGRREDRFFATLFLGSGLLFIAMLFVLAAVADGLVSAPGGTQPQLWGFDRHLVLTILVSYAMRMAAVFTLSTTTIGHGLGLFPRPLSWLGYLVALVLLFVVTSLPWSELAFPTWVVAVSSQILRSSFGTPHARAAA